MAVDEISGTAVRAARDVRVGISRMRRRLRESQDGSELTASQTSLLSRLDRDGPASASELAAAERVRPQSVATSLGVLVEQALVARSPDPSDGRRQVVSLTAAGHDLIAGRRAAGEQWLARALEEHLTESERHCVIEAMTLLDRIAGR